MHLIKSAIFLYTFSAIGLTIFYLCLLDGEHKKLVKRLFFVLAACIIISFGSPNPLVNIILSFFIVPVFARKIEDAACVFIFYFLNMFAVSFQMHIGGLYLFDWYNYSSLAIGTLIYCLLNKRDNTKFSGLSTIAILTIILLYFIIGTRGTSFTNSIRVIVDLACSIFLPFIVIRRSIFSIDNVKSFFVGIASATSSLSALAIYEAHVGWPIYTVLSSHYGLEIGGGNSVKIRGGVLRSAGPFPEPTSFALWLAIGTFLVVISRWMFKSKYYQILSTLLCFYGLISPQSRGALFGLICAFLFYTLLSSKLVKAIPKIFACAICILMLYIGGLVVPSIGSMLGLNSSGTLNRDYRQDLFSRGMEEAYKHPLIGQSVPDVMTSLIDLKQGEGIIDFVNTYLFILLTTGFIGFLAFVVAILSIIVNLVVKHKSFRKYKIDVLSSTSAIIFSISMMIIFTSLVGRTTSGLSMFIAIGGYLCSINPKFIFNNIKNFRTSSLK